MGYKCTTPPGRVAAGTNGQSIGRYDPMIPETPALVNTDLLARWQEFVVLSSATDICLARCERPGADPDECALLRRLHGIFARHGIAAESEAAT